MTGKTNAGGMTVAQAMVKGTADATITAADVLSGKIGYGANGARIVGSLVPPEMMSGTISGNVLASEVTWKSGFIPNFVMLTMTNKSGEFKTPAVVKMRDSSGTWSQIGSEYLHNYYDGSGGSNFGRIETATDKGAKFSGLQSGGNYVWIAWK